MNEKDVQLINNRICALLKGMLDPVAKRIEMPILVEVMETETKLHVDFIYITRTSVMRPRITMDFPNIYELLVNNKNIVKYLKAMESQIRLIKIAVGKTERYDASKKNKLLVVGPGNVIVKFSTRTRYF